MYEILKFINKNCNYCSITIFIITFIMNLKLDNLF